MFHRPAQTPPAVGERARNPPATTTPQITALTFKIAPTAIGQVMTILHIILVLIGAALAFLIQYATQKWRNRSAAHLSSAAGSRYDESSRLVFNVAMQGVTKLFTEDPELAREIAAETAQQVNSLAMVAHASLADPSVLAAAGSVLSNVTAEGYPGRRFHPGAGHFDTVERIAVERAKSVF